MLCNVEKKGWSNDLKDTLRLGIDGAKNDILAAIESEKYDISGVVENIFADYIAQVIVNLKANGCADENLNMADYGMKYLKSDIMDIMGTVMNLKRFTEGIESISEMIKEFESISDKLEPIFGEHAKYNNAFYEIFYDAIDIAIEYLSELSGDRKEWVGWFLFECSCGANPKQVDINGEKILCDSSTVLWDIIKKNK
jgi:hypothetical protein